MLLTTSQIILVYDVSQPVSFNALPTWLAEAREHGGDGVPLIVLGNKVRVSMQCVACLVLLHGTVWSHVIFYSVINHSWCLHQKHQHGQRSMVEYT